MLEAELPYQPVAAQDADRRRIQTLRAMLGRPEVAVATVPARTPRPAKKEPDHTAARELYRRYVARVEELRPHREYAERVARATSGSGRTPVRPMATMGTGGGPLLCDVCGKPMILEGGRWNRVPVDQAWAGTPHPEPDWVSYISGGMVVDITYNGTLRIYHGHVSAGDHECSAKGKAAIEAADAAFKPEIPPGTLDGLEAMLRADRPELSERKRLRLISEVVSTLFHFDPGVGCNRPN